MILTFRGPKKMYTLFDSDPTQKKMTYGYD